MWTGPKPPCYLDIGYSNRVTEFACFDSKLQWARNTCEPKQAKRRDVCCALCHNTAFIFVTYDPQITHGKQIGNRKQTFWKNKVHWVKQTIKWFKFSLWKIIVLAAHGVNGLAYYQEFDNIFALSCRAPKKMSRKRGDFLKTYWAKWLRKQGAFFHGRTVKGVESNIFKCKPRSIFKTLGLIRTTKAANSKAFKAICVTIQLLVRAWSHEPAKQWAWTVCYPLSCFSLRSFAGQAGKRDYLENFQPVSRHHNTGIPANRAGSACHIFGKLIFCCV